MIRYDTEIFNYDTVFSNTAQRWAKQRAEIERTMFRFALSRFFDSQIYKFCLTNQNFYYLNISF